jgi:hypothetical protein
MLTPRRRREPPAPPAPGILAATVAELPELDGAKIAVVSLTHGLHAGKPRTGMHLRASGVTLENDWEFARGSYPARAADTRQQQPLAHHPHGQCQPVAGRRGHDVARDRPPLEPGTAWIEISAAGSSAQARVTLPLSSQ